MKISEKIVNIRNENNLTQEEFAEILGVSRQTVSNWENNKCYPDIATLILISEKFNISFDNMLKEDKEMVKNLDKKINFSKYKKIIISIFILIFLLIAFFLGYKFFLLNYYDNNYSNKIYDEYFENLEHITLEEKNDMANYKFHDLNIYIPKQYYKDYNDRFFYITREEVISLDIFDSNFYEFYNIGEYYKNINFEKIFNKNKIYNPLDLIKYAEVLYSRMPNIFWSKSDLELIYLMKNYLLKETEYGSKYYKRYYFDDDLKGLITEVDNNYKLELYHKDVTYVIYLDRIFIEKDTINEIINSIYFS